MNEIVNIIGKKTIITNFKETDINDTYISWLNDKEVLQYSNQRFIKHTRKSCLSYLSKFKNKNLFLCIRSLLDEKPIGTMTVYYSIPHGTVSIGIMIGNKKSWGSGIGTDSWITLSNWLLKKDMIRKLSAGTLSCNIGMINIMHKSGMHHEATLKKHEVVNNKYEDILYYAKFK